MDPTNNVILSFFLKKKGFKAQFFLLHNYENGICQTTLVAITVGPPLHHTVEYHSPTQQVENQSLYINFSFRISNPGAIWVFETTQYKKKKKKKSRTNKQTKPDRKRDRRNKI